MSGRGLIRPLRFHFFVFAVLVCEIRAHTGTGEQEILSCEDYTARRRGKVGCRVHDGKWKEAEN